MNYLYVILLAVLVTLGGAYKVHSWRVDSLKMEWQAEKSQDLAKQKTALTATCNAEKALTQEVSNVYQNRIAGLDRQLSHARGLLSRSCVSVEGSAPLRHDEAPGVRRPAGQGFKGSGMASSQDGRLPAAVFLDLVGEGERYRLQLLACQSFVLKTQPASPPQGK